MNRRTVLSTLLTGTSIGGLLSGITSASESDRSLPALSFEKRDTSWLSQTLKEHFGEELWRKKPTEGIHFLTWDNTQYIAKSQENVRSRLDWHQKRMPEYSANEFDCEDFTMGLRMRLIREYPKLTIGLAISYNTNHVWLVYPTIEDGVVEYEGINRRIVTSKNGLYNIQKGFVMV